MDEAIIDQLYQLAVAIDNCMTDEAFAKDNTLRTLLAMSEDAFIPLEFFRTKPSVAKFGAPEELMAHAVAKYCQNTLQLDDSQTRLMRLKPFNVDTKRTALTPWSIYVEGLRAPYDTIEKVTELFEKIDSVHHVVFPDSWNGVKKFYGFCFVEFNQPQAVHKAVRLFNRFDLKPKSSPSTSTSNRKATEKEKEMQISSLADELDLRVMTKIEWEKLRTRYIAHKTQVENQLQILWDEINGISPPKPPQQPQPDHTAFIADIRGPRPVKPRRKPSSPQRLASESSDVSYEKGIVVHVDNTQLKTKKSVLKKLFERADVTISFVKYKKDIPSCDVRLASADDAQKLVTYFEKNTTTQQHGDDAQGTRENINALAPLKMRILAGKEEELYWQDQDAKRGRYNQVRQIQNTNQLPKDSANTEASAVGTSAENETNSKTRRSKRVSKNANGTEQVKKPKNTHVKFSDGE